MRQKISFLQLFDKICKVVNRIGQNMKLNPHYLSFCLAGVVLCVASTAQSAVRAAVWERLAHKQLVPKQDLINSFVGDCKKLSSYNRLIPQKNSGDTSTLRIATYNVHYWADPNEKPNFQGIMQTIKEINADVLILQEVVVFDEQVLTQAFSSLGYVVDFTTFGATTNNTKKPFGNMIIARPGLITKSVVKTFDADQSDLHERRCFITTTLQLPHNKHITIVGTHLDVWDNTGHKRVLEVQELINVFQQNSNTIIAGDFNAVRKQDYTYRVNGILAWQLLNEAHMQRVGCPIATQALALLETHGFVDCFTHINTQPPAFTAWSGTIVDFLFINKKSDFTIAGCWSYYCGHSDHCPQVMDIALQSPNRY